LGGVGGGGKKKRQKSPNLSLRRGNWGSGGGGTGVLILIACAGRICLAGKSGLNRVPRRNGGDFKRKTGGRESIYPDRGDAGTINPVGKVKWKILGKHTSPFHVVLLLLDGFFRRSRPF